MQQAQSLKTCSSSQIITLLDVRPEITSFVGLRVSTSLDAISSYGFTLGKASMSLTQWADDENRRDLQTMPVDSPKPNCPMANGATPAPRPSIGRRSPTIMIENKRAARSAKQIRHQLREDDDGDYGFCECSEEPVRRSPR